MANRPIPSLDVVLSNGDTITLKPDAFPGTNAQEDELMAIFAGNGMSGVDPMWRLGAVIAIIVVIILIAMMGYAYYKGSFSLGATRSRR